MNERIEKLGEQADLLGEFTPTKIPGRYVGYITEEQILKFAELIVGECARVIQAQNDDENDLDSWDRGFVAGLATAIDAIEQHFGVES